MYYMFYYLFFLPTGCIRKPLYTETSRQTQETGRQGHYHGKYTYTQTLSVHLHLLWVHLHSLWVHLHSLWAHLHWDTWVGLHLHSDNVGTHALTMGTPALRYLGGVTPTLRHCGYACTHCGHTCSQTLGKLWMHMHSTWALRHLGGGTPALRHCGYACTETKVRQREEIPFVNF